MCARQTVILALFITFFACKKERVYPRIEFDQSNPKALAFADTIRFSFSVTQYEEPVQVAVVDGYRVLPFSVSRWRKLDDHFTYELYTRDRYVESGSYEIRVSAFNGDAQKEDYWPIQFIGLEKERIGLACVEAGGLRIADSTMIFATYFANEALTKVAFNPRAQAVYALKGTSNMMGFSLNNPALPFMRSTAVGVDQGFQNLQQMGLETYLLKPDGKVEVLDSKGQSSRQFSLDNNRYALFLDVEGQRMFCVAAYNFGAPNLYDLLVLNTSTFMVNGTVSLPGVPLDVKTIDEDECLILVDYQDTRGVYYLRARDMTLTPVALTDKSVIGLEVDSHQLAWLYGVDGLYAFNPGGSFLIPPSEVSPLPISSLKRDELSGLFLVSSQNSLRWLNPQSGESQLLLQSVNPILDCAIIYNK